MKNFLLVITLLIVTNLQLSAQWSTDPNNNLVIATGWDPHIVSDSAGGCFVTYNYESFYPQKLAVERLDMYGYKPWGNKKQILGELPEQWQAEIVEDGEGGVIVSYEDNEVIGTDYVTRVRVQRVDSNGNFLWGQTGARVSVEEKTHGAQELVNDGYGGCVVLWQDNVGKYYINRISGRGERTWGDSGKVIGTSAYTAMRIIRTSDNNYYIETGEYIYRIRQNGEIVRRDSIDLGYPVADREGGLVVSGRVWTGMIPKLVAQRRDSLGNNLWQEPYVEIADSLYINTQLIIQNNNSYYYYGWSGTKNGINRVAQFQALRSDGSKLFPQGSISISNHIPLNVAGIVPSVSSKTIFIWNDATISSETISQVYDTLGNKLWNENGVIVSYPAIAYQTYTTDGKGGFIIGGTVNEFTIVAQQVSKYGNLGEIITNISSEENKAIENALTLNQNFPNPFNSSSTIQYSVPSDGNIVIELFNTLGERVKLLVDKYHYKGVYNINLVSDELSSGIYLYRLKTETKSLTKKLIIIK
jgi:hypothetical protein